jgi:hypothetical protein
MIKHLVAAVAVILFVAACSLSSGDEGEVSEAPVPVATASQTPAKTRISKSENGGIPSEIRFTSAVGEVLFLHEMHFKDRAINCVACHHQINAKKLNTPHPEYLQSSAANCQVCHKESEKAVYSCVECHDAKPRDIADETLSAKVVIHKQCLTCHDVGAGAEASKRCVVCHAGKKAL